MQIKKSLKGFSVAAIFVFSAICANSQSKIKAQHSKKLAHNNPITAQRLPLDQNVKTGKLANGFTYFIRRNIHPKDRVIMYLANKVGSILESDDQQGLAHFMEHMNFNGTKTFPKNELVDYLQKAGVRFGADINAYTGFDETVYQLPLPTDKPEILRNGIQIMHDWAQGALLYPAEIEKERGVVLEEKRLGKGASQRMQQKYFPILFGNSRYGKRLPIGLDTVLNNFKASTLVQFYRDWYRPNLQALIVVGDINVDEMEKEIRIKFADLKNPIHERPRIKYDIQLKGTDHFAKVTDPEMTSTQVQVLIKREAHPLRTEQDYREYIIRKLFNQMLADRYSGLSQSGHPPFIAGTASISNFIGNLEAFNAQIIANPGELENGFKAAWREVERLKKYGFTADELDRAKKNFLLYVENTYKEKSTAYSDGFVNEYLNYFLHGTAAPGIEKELSLTEKYLPAITLSNVNAYGQKFINSVNRDIIITAPDKDKSNLPGEATINAWIMSVTNEAITPYKNNFKDEPLIDKEPLPGRIVKESNLEGIMATEFTLSNGARIILKPTKLMANTVLVKAFAPGGSSLYSNADYESANVASYLVSKAGLGPFDYNQLNKFLSATTVSSSVYVSDYSQGIQAAATPLELKTLLQMVYLYFTNPKKDSTEFKKYIFQSKASLSDREKSPENVFYDTLSSVLGNNSPRRSPPSITKLDQINYERSYEIYKERFADAANFTFTFVGDFETDKVKPLIEQYIASLPSTYKHEKAKDIGIRPPAGKKSKMLYKGMENKATVRLTFSGSYEFNTSNNLSMDAMAEVLQIRLIERLREEESGVYSPSVSVRYSKIPLPGYTFNISFGCAPANVEKLIASALDEVNKLKTQGPKSINIDKFKAEQYRIHETQLQAIDFWSEYITEHILNEEDLNDVNDYDGNMKKITAESIKAMAIKYLSGDNLISIILIPENLTKAK